MEGPEDNHFFRNQQNNYDHSSHFAHQSYGFLVKNYILFQLDIPQACSLKSQTESYCIFFHAASLYTVIIRKHIQQRKHGIRGHPLWQFHRVIIQRVHSPLHWPSPRTCHYSLQKGLPLKAWILGTPLSDMDGYFWSF